MIKLGVDDLARGSFNRTFMELKLFRIDKDPNGNFVLIVPLWNWNNEHYRINPRMLCILIVPLWNWNLPSKEGYA